MLERASAGICMLMKGAYGVVVRGKHMGRAITSVTVIMTDAWIGLTISSYHHQLVMSNEDVFAGFASVLTHPRERERESGVTT